MYCLPHLMLSPCHQNWGYDRSRAHVTVSDVSDNLRFASKKRSSSRSDVIFQTKIGDFTQPLNLSSVRARSLCSSLPYLQAEHLLSKGVPVTVNATHMQVSYHTLLHFLSFLDKLFREYVSGLFQEQPILCLSLSVSF